MKPKHLLLAALCAVAFAGTAQAAIPEVDCAGVPHWTNASGYPQGEAFFYRGFLYRTSVAIARGYEPMYPNSPNDFELLGRCEGRSRPAMIFDPMNGLVLYQGVRPAAGYGFVYPMWGGPIRRVGVHFNGEVLSEHNPPFESFHQLPIILPQPTRLGPARLDIRVEYEDGSQLTETAQLIVLPGAEQDREAPVAPRALLESVGADTATIRWDPVKDAPGGSDGVRYRVTLARQTYVLDEGVTSVKLSDLRPNTRHLVNVEAVDLAGNASPKSLVIAQTTL
ncbi:fibronectin type III domain-containing protein [Pinirhizobacter soli]|uniref:fibronectin type III domain-containing protein n=1 Tax=Pinirhizobacter soli TaxID=2786953 RepID=UPI00202A113E|nr:fibronectin type III domain-containing protein [Pinirhizobacter soli]